MEQIRMVSLKCPECGGALEISAQMQRFACGYCGTNVVVSRAGGTISLGVEQAIANVQKGTDKTAAELAIPRLEREIQAARERAREPLAALAGGKHRRYKDQFNEFLKKLKEDKEIAAADPTRPKGFFRGLFANSPRDDKVKEVFTRFEAEFEESERALEETICAEVAALERRLEEQRKIANS